MRKLLCILSSIILSTSVYAQKTEIKPGDDASHYKLNIVTSKETIKTSNVSDLRGNIIIMQWWDILCSGSKEQLKSFNAFYQLYGKQISFYGVSKQPLSTIEKFKERNNYQFNFCRDAAQLKNKFFPYDAKGHMVIINRKGICLYHGSFILSTSIIDTLLEKDNLPLEFQKLSEESYKFKQFRNEFEENRKSLDSFNQTAFKLEPYTSSVKSTQSRINGKSFYGYNLPIYEIYRDGLLLNDKSIIISNALKKKLTAADTSNLYMVGFNLRKQGKYSNIHYRKVFKAYLDSAFGLSTNLLKKKEEIIVITKINEGPNIKKTDHIWKNETKGDSIFLNNFNAQDIVDQLNKNNSNLFFSTIIKQDKYDVSLTLNKNSTNKEQIVQQLNKQGIDSKLSKEKIQYLEFLPENDNPSINYFHTKQKRNNLKFGFTVGYGKGMNDYMDSNYQGSKTFAIKAGLLMQVRLTNYLSLQPGVYYLTSGCKGDYGKFRIHSLNVPVNVLLTTSQQKPLGLYAKGGGYYSYNFAGKVEGENLNFDHSIEKNKFGWCWGIGLWFGNNGTWDLTYNRGISNILKNSTIGDAKERMWMLTHVIYF